MRVVVTGASGNVGTSVLSALMADERIDSVVGVSRRSAPTPAGDRLSWRTADVIDDPLEPIFEGADAVVHLAWAIQPSRDDALLRATNVIGSRRVFNAAGAAVRTWVLAGTWTTSDVSVDPGNADSSGSHR